VHDRPTRCFAFLRKVIRSLMSIRKVSLGEVSSYKLPFFVAMVCVFTLLCSSSIAWAAQDTVQPASSGAPRIVEHVDENHLATLTGNTRPEARAEFDRGPVAPTLAMGDLILVLRRGPEQQAAFDAFLAAQQDSSSPSYHHWLTPDEIGQKFGPAQADIAAIQSWLQGHGLSVTNISRDRMSIRFGGMATQVESAFHTEIHNLQVKGEDHIANMSDPSIPEALTPVVVGVKALHNFFPHPLHKLGSAVRRNPQGGWTRISSPASLPAKPVSTAAGAKQVRPLFGTGGTTSGLANEEDIAPYDFATIYNVLPLWNAATPISGAGQTIAIAGTSNINLADVTTFRSAFGLPAYTAANSPKVIITNTDPGDCSTFSTDCQNDLVENTLDVEWSGAIAPGAQIALVTSSATTTTTDSLFASEQYIVDNVTARIMNVSYGECELGLGTAGNTTYSNMWSTAEMAGIAVFVSTGDSGAASCDDGQDAQFGVPYGAQFGLSVSGFASTPYNTAVGGTDFAWSWVNNGASQSTYWGSTNNATTQASALGYIPEFPWNSTCSNPLLVALFNSELSENFSAAQMCDDIGTGAITSDGGSLLSLVDTVGGSGGASNCINGDGQHTTSCSQGYPKPSWQTGVTGIPGTNARFIPDVSFFAANGFSGSAYVICVSAAGTCSYTAGTEPDGEEVGGTSVASPIMAAVAALVNQKVGKPEGNLNTSLYQFAGSESYPSCSSEKIPLTGSSCVFNDIDTGTIAMPCDVGSPNCTTGSEAEFSVQTGYAATAGYDPASGLGSVNVSNLVNKFSVAASPLASPSPTLLLFGNTAVGTTDPTTQAVTLKNSGTSPLTISGISIGGANAVSFSQTNTCGTGLATGASCTVTVTFAPTAAGALAATLSIAGDADGSPETVSLNGTGFVPTPAATLNYTSLDFGAIQEGTTDPNPATVILSSTGNEPLAISGISITGTNASSFSQTNTCSTTTPLAVGSTCSVTVTFAPATVGTFTAAVNIADNAASGSPQTVTLSGTGFAPAPIASLTPTSQTFPNIAVGTSYTSTGIALSNTGTLPLVVSGISITGTNASSFTQTNNCGTFPVTIAPTSGCTITVTFTPTAVGVLTASVSVADNASGSPQVVTLAGTGVPATPPGFALTNSGGISVIPGVTSGNTSTITITPAGGFTGMVSLSCSIAPTAANDPATCSIPASVSVSGVTTAALSIGTTAATSALAQPKNLFWPTTGGAVLALVVFFGIPARRRNWPAMLGLFVLFVSLGAIGCGGGGGNKGGGGGGGNAGTTAGTYTVTVTGTSDTITQTTTVTLTVQ
jgi:subtilase family serine protease